MTVKSKVTEAEGAMVKAITVKQTEIKRTCKCFQVSKRVTKDRAPIGRLI